MKYERKKRWFELKGYVMFQQRKHLRISTMLLDHRVSTYSVG